MLIIPFYEDYLMKFYRYKLWGSSLARLFSTCSIIFKKSSKEIVSGSTSSADSPMFCYCSNLIWARRPLASSGSLYKLCIMASRSLILILPTCYLSKRSNISLRLLTSSSENCIGYICWSSAGIEPSPVICCCSLGSMFSYISTIC